MRLGEHQRSVLNPENPKKRSWSFAKGPGISVWSSNPATWNRWRPAPVLGVDIGENNRAATSTGKVFGGGALRHKRDCHLALRRRLRSHGSQSARQKLRQVSGKEAQRIRHIDHKTNKAIVAEAGRIGARKIVMKDMRHIRSRIKAGKCMRANSIAGCGDSFRPWSSTRPRLPASQSNTSTRPIPAKTCSAFGALGQRIEHRFVCEHWDLRAHSDLNGSRNLARIGETAVSPRTAVDQPHVGDGQSSVSR